MRQRLTTGMWGDGEMGTLPDILFGPQTTTPKVLWNYLPEILF